jgi:hypothetical protein
LKNNRRSYREGYCGWCLQQALRLGELKRLPKPNCLQVNNFTQQQENVLTGLMLGDGNLYKRPANLNAALQVHRCQKDLDYLEFQANLFKEFITPAGICKYDYHYKYKGEPRTNHQCSFRTHAHPLFTNWYNLWYPNNHKTIPNNLELNSEIIAHWFCDDGCTFPKKNTSCNFSLELSTNGFSKEEVYFLRDKLIDRYNENFVAASINKGQYYFISCSNNAARALLLDINLHISGFMERKSRIWRQPSARLFENIPERTGSKEKNIIEFILKEKVFTISDLAKHFNSYEKRVLRSGNITTRPSATTFRPYLKKYVSQFFIEREKINNQTYVYKITKLGLSNLKFDSTTQNWKKPITPEGVF